MTDGEYADIWLRADVHYGEKDCLDKYYLEYINWMNEADNRYDILIGDVCNFGISTADKYKYMITQNVAPQK